MKIWKITYSIIVLILSNSINAATLHSSDWETTSSLTYTTRFGSPEIVSPTGILNNNSLAFNTSGNAPSFYYDQIQYNIDSESLPYTSFNLSFDIYTESLIGSNNQFSILFDTPTVRSLIFTNEGYVEVQPGWASKQVLSAYSENEGIHVDMMFDIGNNVWGITLNNLNIYSGIIDNTSNPFLQPADYLQTIRFSQGLKSSGDSPSHNAIVYLDNVVISAVPVPAAGWLFASGFLGLLGLARRKTPH